MVAGANRVLATNHEGSNGDKIIENELTVDIMKWPAVYDCDKTAIIMKIVNHNKELPMIDSIGVLQIPPQEQGGQPRMLQAPITLYYNQATGTYSIVAKFENGHACIILFGHGIKPSSEKIIPTDEWKKHLKKPAPIDPTKLQKVDDDQKFNLT
ncbi:MAG: hypothetical protein OR994_08115 [Candidatus Poseidoniales archaeon]|nr:hypothetical protein [Candidatus Poseidoniales archaeon]